MNFVFNELCVSNLETFSQDDFNQWLNDWLEMLVYSQRLFKEKPCVYSDTYTMGLLPYPCIERWMGTVSRDKRMLFYGLIDRHPYLKNDREPLAYNEFLVSDFLYNGTTAKGLGVAYLLDGIAFSFPSDDKWDTPYLNIKVRKIDIDDSEKIYDVRVMHAIRNEHLHYHKMQMKSLEACLEKISNLALLREYWEQEFPNLRKSDNVFEYMEKTTLNKDSFSKVVKNLFKLNRFLAEGENNIVNLGNCSDESDTTKQKYGEKREFLFEGLRRRCYFHFKLKEINWRIHFDIDYENRIAYVGYIGKHLPI